MYVIFLSEMIVGAVYWWENSIKLHAMKWRGEKENVYEFFLCSFFLFFYLASLLHLFFFSVLRGGKKETEKP
jgi:hypothetical protein